MAAQEEKKSSPALIAVAWLIVIIPAGWGLNYTVQNAMKLFRPAPAAVTAPVNPGTVTPAPPAAK